MPRNAQTGVVNYAIDETPNNAGKRTNRGFEGLAVGPLGLFSYAMLQSAMLDEGGSNGTINRVLHAYKASASDLRGLARLQLPGLVR